MLSTVIWGGEGVPPKKLKLSKLYNLKIKASLIQNEPHFTLIMKTFPIRLSQSWVPTVSEVLMPKIPATEASGLDHWTLDSVRSSTPKWWTAASSGGMWYVYYLLWSWFDHRRSILQKHILCTFGQTISILVTCRGQRILLVIVLYDAAIQNRSITCTFCFRMQLHQVQQSNGSTMATALLTTPMSASCWTLTLSSSMTSLWTPMQRPHALSTLCVDF